MDMLYNFIPNKVSNVLDIGAGTGFFLENITKKIPMQHALGVEVNEKYFIQNERFLITDSENIPDIEFDMLSFVDVLHHVTNKELFVKNYLCYIKNGGYILIKDMNPEKFIYKWFNRLHDLIFAREFIQEITINEVIKILETFGFILEKKETQKISILQFIFII
jgi:2-polyprenyl-3-methyl-5-hydroxy-6-metoxy-1,4-benzoquinol methylase